MQFRKLFDIQHLIILLIFIVNLSYGQSPGGVNTDLVLWLKANEGLNLTVPVQTWNDQSNVPFYNATQPNAINRPSVHTSEHNYNPAVYFDNQFGSVSEYLVLDDLINPASTGLSIIAVGTNELGGDNWHAMFSGQTNIGWTNGGFGLGYIDDDHTFGFWVNDWYNHASTGWLGGPLMPPEIVEGKFDANQITYYQNTLQAGTFAFNGTVGDSGDTFIGAGGSPNNDNHFGHIAEIIVYSSPISDAERYRISSYLGIKYGISISRYGIADNYVASDNTSIYTVDSGDYWRNIIGIGRDNASGLHQKQSQDEGDHTHIYTDNLEIDNITNINNGTDISDNQFVVMGNNGGMIGVVIDTNENEIPAGVLSRLDREWKVKNTGFTDTFSIDIEMFQCVDENLVVEADLRLLVDTDENFTNATVVVSNAVGPQITYDAVNHYVNISNIPTSLFPTNATTYFTLASMTEVTFDDFFVANQPANIHTCATIGTNNEYGDFSGFLTDLENQIINGQTTTLDITYYYNGSLIDLSSDAFTNTNPTNQEITVRVTNWADCYDETTFEFIVDPLPDVDTLTSVSSCLAYELPQFANANNYYFTGDLGTGTAYAEGYSFDVLGTTTLYIFADDGTCINQSSFDITIDSMPLIDTSLDDVEICGSYELPILTDGAFYTETGGTGSQLNVGDVLTTSQEVFVYASNGSCEDEYSFEVTIFPIYDFDLTLDNIVVDNQVDIQVNMESLPITYEYQIDNEGFQLDNQFFDLTGGIHTLTVRDSDSCVEKSIDIRIIIFKIPKFFTPNGDGIYDYWEVLDSENSIKYIHIFDRFGRFIYDLKPNSQGWDGTVNNVAVPSSDYWYVLEIQTDNEVLMGHFTLKR